MADYAIDPATGRPYGEAFNAGEFMQRGGTNPGMEMPTRDYNMPPMIQQILGMWRGQSQPRGLMGGSGMRGIAYPRYGMNKDPRFRNGTVDAGYDRGPYLGNDEVIPYGGEWQKAPGQNPWDVNQMPQYPSPSREMPQRTRPSFSAPVPADAGPMENAMRWRRNGFGR
jgi:hypothetical protein